MITLATLPQATAQQVFDQVATHLMKQRKVSRNFSTKMCAYRGADGLKCAAGCLVSDEEYKPEMENLAWDQLSLRKHRFTVPEGHRDLITQLQQIHDEADDEVGIDGDVYDYWLGSLRGFAEDEKLEPTKLMYRVIGEDDEVLETYWTLAEAESRTAALEDTYLQCPGDF